MAGDLNINCADPEGNRKKEDIATTIATEGLEDMDPHFIPQQLWRCQ